MPENLILVDSFCIILKKENKMEKIIVNKDYKELHSLISTIFKDDDETEVVIERRFSDKAYNYIIERCII